MASETTALRSKTMDMNAPRVSFRESTAEEKAQDFFAKLFCGACCSCYEVNDGERVLRLKNGTSFELIREPGVYWFNRYRDQLGVNSLHLRTLNIHLMCRDDLKNESLQFLATVQYKHSDTLKVFEYTTEGLKKYVDEKASKIFREILEPQVNTAKESAAQLADKLDHTIINSSIFTKLKERLNADCVSLITFRFKKLVITTSGKSIVKTFD